MNRMDMRMRDMRNPYGSRGGYVSSRRRRDRLMMEDMRRYNEGKSDYTLDEMTRQNQEIRHDPYMPRDYARGRGGRRYTRNMQSQDYGTGEPYAGVDDFYERNDMARGNMSRNSRDYGGMRGSTYYPIEAMGTFNGYWGVPEEDYARGRNRRDYAYDYRYDYNYDYAGDYGESLTKDELEHWKKKLMKEVEDKDKHFFESTNISNKARQMGVQMKDYSEDELALVTLMLYTDYCKTMKKYIGSNMDIYVELAKDWLEDKDSAIKGSERLAVYHDCIIEDEEDD